MFHPDTKILIVDDLVGMRKLIKQQLQGIGFKNITEAGNGQEAYTLIMHELHGGTPFQLIFSDWNMPVMTGIALLRLVRQTPETANLPFLLITAEGEFSQVKEAMMLRVSDYIVKPFTPAILKTKLESAWKKCQPK